MESIEHLRAKSHSPRARFTQMGNGNHLKNTNNIYLATHVTRHRKPDKHLHRCNDHMKRKHAWPQGGSQATRTRHTKQINISLAYANIEDMNKASLTELQHALTTLKNRNGFSPTMILLTETWECKLACTQYQLDGYTYTGKPIDRLPQATRAHGGTGAWIKTSIANQCTAITPTKTNPNILWIQMMGDNNTRAQHTLL